MRNSTDGGRRYRGPHDSDRHRGGKPTREQIATVRGFLATFAGLRSASRALHTTPSTLEKILSGAYVTRTALESILAHAGEAQPKKEEP